MNPPGQSSIEALHTITTIYRREEGDDPPSSIEHRGLAYCCMLYIERGRR